MNHLYRYGYEKELELMKSKKQYCTMMESIDIVKIKNKRGKNKKPKLCELYRYYFKESFKNSHNAKYDVLATAKCLTKLI